jgi:3-isopropylmalate/(R)-2-methylmalate dehydratase small subunit
VTGPDGKIDHFEIDSFRKDCLLRGIDSVTLTLSHASEIAAFEARQKEEVSWL